MTTKTNKSGLVKLKSFCKAKETLRVGENICHKATGKILINKIYKHLK